MEISFPAAKIEDQALSQSLYKGSYVDMLAQCIDKIEYLRGQFSALSYVDTKAARDVHILRLRNTFQRAGIEKTFRFSLKVLDLMREVQNLGNGYWRGTPLRIVPIDNFAILVSSLPTKELQRHFDGVECEGYARAFPSPGILDFPQQNLDDWLGLNVRDSVVWCENLINFSADNMQPTIHSSHVQFYTILTTRFPYGTAAKPHWTDDPRISLRWRDKIALCRERVAGENYRYFFGELRGKKLIAEKQISQNVSRVVYGFSANVKKPITVDVVITKNGEAVFHIPASFPRPEWQLLLALGKRDGKQFRVRREVFVSVIVDRLRRLGCDVRTMND